MPATSLTTSEAAAQIARNGDSWAGLGALDTPAAVTYGFRLSPTRPDFVPCTDAQIASFEMALSLFADVANITFDRVNPAGYTDDATMLFSSYFEAGTEAAGYAAKPLDGDVWINLAYESAESQPLGSYDFKTILHELGHAVGLDHPGDYNGGTGETISYADHAGYVEDSRQFSLMSYFEAYETGGMHFSGASVHYASTLLLHDIAAVQRLYGANTTTRTGDTVYGFNSTAGIDSYDFTKNAAPVIAIWDAGGTHDVLDTSGYYLNQIIDLRAGAFSDIGGMRKNVAIAEGVTIEHAVGGSADDQMTGNDAGNLLTGNNGWDTLSGEAGDDMLDGGIGNDTLDGGADDDGLYGGFGDDTLTGGDGADKLDGGVGDDEMTGGGGSDVYTVDSFDDWTIESDASTSTGGTDTVVSTISYWLNDNIEKLVLTGVSAIEGAGNALGNSLTGSSAANMLWGAGGNDILAGKSGRDVMEGGAGLDDFDFDSVKESGRSAVARDIITDFAHLRDDIDLRDIDASSRAAGNQVFKLIGTAGFHKTAGELRFQMLNPTGTAADKTIVEGDVNGDGRADFQIELTGLIGLTKADFLL